MANTTPIQMLRDIRTRFDGTHCDQRQSLLQQIGKLEFTDAAELREYHDTLLFMAAHPDDAAILRLCESELARIGKTIALWTLGQKQKLKNTGMSGTTTRHPFTLDLIRWLVARCADDADLDWAKADAIEKLEQFLPHVCAHIDADGLLNQRFDTREWIDIARGKSTPLAWLIARFDQIPTTSPLREKAFESLGFDISWTHQDARFSRTGVRFPERPVHFQQGHLTRSANVNDILTRPLSGKPLLPRRQAVYLIDACRVALASRRRETDPVTYANESEVMLFRLDHGIDVAILGAAPDRRLPIESFFGFVAARNRVPCSYGGGWVLGKRCEIGVNIFDEFRGGESALLFAQIMRVYHQCFGVTRFLVDPFQFGAGNPEAIQSGAFWFYYRLGFRPVDEKLHRLADEEAAKIQTDRTYRTTPNKLRRLAGDKVRFDLADAADMPGDFDLADLGIALTKWIGTRFDSDLTAAEKWAERQMFKTLRIRPSASWSESESCTFKKWSLLYAMIPDLRKWPAAEKQLAAKIMIAKGGVLERTFALLLQKHTRLLAALAKLAQGVPHA